MGWEWGWEWGVGVGGGSGGGSGGGTERGGEGRVLLPYSILLPTLTLAKLIYSYSHDC